MTEENHLEISLACPADYAEIVALFNKNNVYQFPDGAPLTVEDFDLVMKIKEVKQFFLVRQNGKLIGTSAFFKFITHECLDLNSSFSGFLLIDSESRSGQAITYLYKTILERITQLGFSNLFTEISKYNKPSLSLSRLNGFHDYSQTYEDILHCRSLRSNLPKVIKTFCLSDYHGKTYDISTFEILNEVEDVATQETLIQTQISGEKLVFKVQDDASLPYFLKMDLFQLAIVKEGGRYYLDAEFLADEVEKIQAKVGKRHVSLTRSHKRCALGRQSLYSVQAQIMTKHGMIAVQLERLLAQKNHQLRKLNQSFYGYQLQVTDEGDLLFCKDERVVFKDSFIIFSKPLQSVIKVKEKLNQVELIWACQGARIHKRMNFSGDSMTCTYTCNSKAQVMMPEVLKQGFNIFCQEHLIRENDGYHVNRPSLYPLEHDDFLRCQQFEDNCFDYLVPSEQCQITYRPLGKASNQMQFRPLSICQASELNQATYQLTFSEYHAAPKEVFEHSLYQMTDKNLLKSVSAVTLEEEHGYGTKRLLANRKSYDNTRLVLAHNQIVLPEAAIPNDCKQAAISFTFKIKGNLEQLRFDESIPYQNKAHILENQRELIIYDEKQDRYLQLTCPNGVFYSYKENNSLKIRCVFDTTRVRTVNVRLMEYKRR